MSYNIFFYKGSKIQKHIPLILFALVYFSHLSIKAMEHEHPAPMDSPWFYDTTHAFTKGNQLHEKQNWEDAADKYSYIDMNIIEHKLAKEIKEDKRNIHPSDFKNNMKYDEYLASETESSQHKARLNRAACLLALGKSSEDWASFDDLLNIPKHQRLYHDEIKKQEDNDNELRFVLVSTDFIGIGDIFCFLSAVKILRKRTLWQIILSVPKFLHKTLAQAEKKYHFILTNPEDKESNLIHHKTHLISLLGHLKLIPAQLIPEKVVFTAPERALNAVLEQLQPILNQDNIIVVADRGEVDRKATVIGGRQLYSRHLSSIPFNNLLNNYPNITLLDCSFNKKNPILVDDQHKTRCLTIAAEEQPFNTIIALGRIMSNTKNIIAFGPDMGQANVFMRSLNHDAQNRMAFIIPNSRGYDVRIEGNGSMYKHMISNCWVYKRMENQTKTIDRAYNDMLQFTT